MTQWYSPSQLMRTAPEVATSTLFGRHADNRVIEALMHRRDTIYDYSTPRSLRTDARGAVWIDYVADTGDGWNSTYAVAYHLVQTPLVMRDAAGVEHTTEPGGILIFGGDQVYPMASRQAYEEKLLAPYEAARRRSNEPHPVVFAIPGNHDWYDSLTAFARLFMGRGWIGGWKCPQERSYFAIKLPHGWWLLGTDMQLGSDIDTAQVCYFEAVRKKMAPDDRVILCNAEPQWIQAHIHGCMNCAVYNENNLRFVEKVLGRSIDVIIAGDLHHYRRHEAVDGAGRKRQKITAGGGGAFLHPTHKANVENLADGYKLRASFPTPRESARLTWRNVLFPWTNFSFGLLPGLMYLLVSWSVMADLGKIGFSRFGAAVTTTLTAALLTPGSLMPCLLLFGCIYLFTDTTSSRYRFIGGTLHGMAHLFAAFLIGWGATYLTVHELKLPPLEIPQMLLSGFLIFTGGWVIGSLLMGLYLLVSLNVFGFHANEAFSALAIQDWKNFVRFKVEHDRLTIYPIGLRRVPRKWKARSGGQGPEWEPDDKRATAPELIEPPIVLERNPVPPPRREPSP